MEKFKIRKKTKRLRKRHLDESKDKVKVNKHSVRAIRKTIVQLSEYSGSSDDLNLQTLFVDPDVNNITTTTTTTITTSPVRMTRHGVNQPGPTALSQLILHDDDPLALALEEAEICPLDFPTSPNQNKATSYKGECLPHFISLDFPISTAKHLLDTNTSTVSDDSDNFDHEAERRAREEFKQARTAKLQREVQHQQQQHS